MRERYNAVGYNFGKTAYRNLYQARQRDCVAGGHPLYVMKTHAVAAPKTSMTPSVYVPAHMAQVLVSSYVDDNGVRQDTYEEQMIPGHEEATGATVVGIGAVDIANWIHIKINNHRPSCKVSFICTLVQESGLMSQADLDILIDHKLTEVKKTTRGRAMVLEYHKLGGILERKMQSDLRKSVVYKYVYETWLVDILAAVKTGEFDVAEKLYIECLYYLIDKYKVKIDDKRILCCI